jgi:hypothetical protein
VKNGHPLVHSVVAALDSRQWENAVIIFKTSALKTRF